MTRKIKYKQVSENLRQMVDPTRTSNTRSSMGLEKAVGEYFFISVDDLIPFKNQARQIFDEDDIKSLAESITQYGIRQPLTVARSDTQTNKYEVISGERRLRAAKVAGLVKVPCIILNDSHQVEAIALIENIHRQDLHPLELGLAYKKALDAGIFATKLELASKVAISKSSVSENIQLAELPESVRDYILKNNITTREHLREFISRHNAGVSIETDILIDSGIRNTKSAKSVLRVLHSADGMKFQDAGIRKLDHRAKQELKAYLKNLLSRI